MLREKKPYIYWVSASRSCFSFLTFRVTTRFAVIITLPLAFRSCELGYTPGILAPVPGIGFSLLRAKQISVEDCPASSLPFQLLRT